MVENIKIHFNDVQNYIIKSDKEEYYTYPAKVKKALNEESRPKEGGKPILDFDTSVVEEFIDSQVKYWKNIAHQYKQK
jgi:hypothetical protein